MRPATGKNSAGSTEMLTLHRIFEIYGLDPARVKLVRHSNKELIVLDTFRQHRKRLEVYQSYQRPARYGDAGWIAVFASYYRTTALFLGMWEIRGCRASDDLGEGHLQELEGHGLPTQWLNDHVRYDLEWSSLLEDLSERLVIEWGGATVSWVQQKDKEIVEIKGAYAVQEFRSFDGLILGLDALRRIVEHPDQNQTWVKALSSVNGVYLIRDGGSGKLYVGSAYGEQGLYGRWRDYATSGHGGNLELKTLDAERFTFSILEIVPSTATAEYVIACENKWKEKLGTRRFGLNKN